MESLTQLLTGLPPDFRYVYIGILRILAPILMILILYRTAKPLLSFRREPEIWGILRLPDGSGKPILHWENVIGRDRRCDIRLEVPTISRNHAVLTRYDDGSWTISDAGSKGGVKVNGDLVDIWALEDGDVMELGGLELMLEPSTEQQNAKLQAMRTKASTGGESLLNLFLLTAFQLLCCFGYLVNGNAAYGSDVVLGFSGILIAQWSLMIFYASIRRSAFEVETIAFLLCTMGMCVIASTAPSEAFKQLIAMVIGLAAFLFLGWSLRDLERAKVVRYAATIAGIGFLVITLLFGKEIYGAKNWLIIGGYSIQPSELSKVCFVFAGASTMDRIMQKRNIILFIGYSAVLCGLLALMNDFGTALIFFVAFLAIAYMRSGSMGTIALAIFALIFAGVIVLKIAPHALSRFDSWRHIWEDPYDSGYQQTRCLMCIAAGGLFGLGAGNGWMKNLFASDTDVIFATVAEEWGLIAAFLMVGAVVVLAIFCLRSAGMGRSCFYTIGACTAASILLIQTILNILGTLDVLPFTGVTFPFVSNGGSSMISAWALMAFVKAGDTRKDASFAIRAERNREGKK